MDRYEIVKQLGEGGFGVVGAVQAEVSSVDPKLESACFQPSRTYQVRNWCQAFAFKCNL
jgi:serine/threonine protein kinase